MRVTAESLVVILAALATTVLAIVAAMWMARRRRDVELRQPGNPLLVMPVNIGLDGPVRVPIPGTPARRPSAIRAVALSEFVHADVGTDAIEELAPVSGPVSVVEDAISGTTVPFQPGTQPAEVIHGHSLRFHRPPEGTLAMLPGHLEVVGGPDAGHEIRFVRASDSEPPDITFGRKEGPPYRHVQLLEPTVSRTHARLSREGDRWRLTNLSRTNPVVVNGTPLDGVNNSTVLDHSDVVEMGALVFRYHHA